MLILIVAGGPDKGRMYELNEGAPTIVGRESGHIRLSDRKASREHARLWCEGGRWYLRDLGSKHGTFRNHERLQGQAPLADGDYVQIGNTVFVVARMAPANGEAPAISKTSADATKAPAWKRYATPALAAAALLLLAASLVLTIQSKLDEAETRNMLAALQQQQNELAGSDVELAKRIDASLQSAGDRQDEQLARLNNSIDRVTPAMADLGETLVETNRGSKALAESLQNSEQTTNNVIALLNVQQTNHDELLGQIAWIKKSQEARGDLLAEAMHELRFLPEQVPGLAEKMDTLATQMSALPDAQVVSKLGLAMQKDTEATRELLARAVAALEAQPDADAMAAALRQQLTEDVGAMGKLVTDALAELQPGASADEVSAAIQGALAERAKQTDTLLAEVLAKLEESPTSEAIAAELREQVAADQQQLAAELKDSLKTVVARLDDAPTRDQLVEDLQAVIRHDGRHAESALVRVLERLDQTPTARQLADDLRLAMAKDDASADALLRQVLEELEKRPTSEQLDERFAKWSKAERESNAKAAHLMVVALKKLEEQRDIGGEIDALRERLAEQPAEMRELTEKVIARLDADSADRKAVLETMREVKAALPEDMGAQLAAAVAGLDQQIIKDEITAAVEKAIAQLAEAQNEQNAAAMEAIKKSLAEAPNADAVAKLTDLVAKQVDALLVQTDNTKTLRQLSEEVRKLAEGREDDPTLKKVLAAIDTQRDIDAQLVEIRTMLKDVSQIDSKQLAQVVEAANAATAEETHAMLKRMLDKLRTDVAFKTDVELAKREIITDVRMRLLQSNRDMLPLENVGELSVNGNPNERLGSDAEDIASLTKTELAYKNAFSSGRVVELRVPAITDTGTEMTSRKLDPRTAKAAGFESWREWYRADMERVRTELVKQQNRMNNQQFANPQRDMIQLPSGDAGELDESRKNVSPR